MSDISFISGSDEPEKKTENVSVIDVLDEMKKTFSERNSTYGDNYIDAAKVLGILFPNGVDLYTLTDPVFYMVFLKVLKLTRFCRSGLRHIDSIHDDAIYSAMAEKILRNSEV